MKDRPTRDGVASKLMSYTFHAVKEKKGWGGRQGRRVKEGRDDDRDRGMRGGGRKQEEEDRGEEEEGGGGGCGGTQETVKLCSLEVGQKKEEEEESESDGVGWRGLEGGD